MNVLRRLLQSSNKTLHAINATNTNTRRKATQTHTVGQSTVFAETTIPQPTLSITINRPTNLLRAIIVEEMIRLKGHVG